MGVPISFLVVSHEHTPPALHSTDKRWGHQEKPDKQSSGTAYSMPSPQLTAQVYVLTASVPTQRELGSTTAHIFISSRGRGIHWKPLHQGWPY